MSEAIERRYARQSVVHRLAAVATSFSNTLKVESGAGDPGYQVYSAPNETPWTTSEWKTGTGVDRGLAETKSLIV